jgi:8-oxo-dGTP pyrophosphatase MutT (NUDIX family)
MRNEILPAVSAAIFDDRGRVLLHKRRDVDQWCVISGHVEFGESVEQAILREIREEANADASIIRLIGVYSSPPSQLYQYENRNIHYVTTYFEVALDSRVSENFSNDETAAIRFFDINEIPENFAKINPYWLKDALNRRGPAVFR